MKLRVQKQPSRERRGTRAGAPLFPTLAVALALGGCTGDLGGISDRSSNGDQPGDGDQVGDGDNGPVGEGMLSPTDEAKLPWDIDFAGTGSPLRRLSRDELVTTITVLLGSSPERSAFPEEPRQGHGLLVTSGVSFIDPEVRQLWEVVTSAAEYHAAGALAGSGCAASGAEQVSCLKTWAADFGKRALRRPLSTNESTKLNLLLDSAGNPDYDQIAVESVLIALFSSPSFLFRTEIGEPTTEATTTLLPLELASRLSYLVTLAPPDAELLASAEAGTLSDPAERLRQFQRLSATPLAANARSVFILEWLNANESKVAKKSAAYLEGLPEGFAQDIRSSVNSAIESVLGSPSPTISGLLSTTGYLSDPAVQAVTAAGVAAGNNTGDNTETNRQGLLLHPYVIASHTKENGSSPFQIGIALSEAVLCAKVGAPPAGATDLVKTDPPAGLSSRETLEYVTSAQPVCSNCHATFAPIGYSMMAFDPVGRWMSADPSGKPWDLSGTLPDKSGELITFSSGSELAQKLGEHPQVLGCFAEAALKWSLGRKLASNNGTAVLALNEVSQESGGSVVSVLEALVTSEQFLLTQKAQ